MEQAEAGSGLQDVPFANGQPNGHLKEVDNKVEDMAVCASPGAMKNKRRKEQQQAEDSLAGMLRRALVDHQLGLSVNCMLLVTMTYLLFPRLRPEMIGFFTLSYPSNEDGQYSQGPKDLWLVASFVVLFTAVRAACVDYLLLPLAALCGIHKQKGKIRFAEQGYLLLYYILYWTWGLLLFIQDTPSNVRNTNDLLVSIWRDYPRLTTTGPMKIYYLSQFAFWVQQIAVIHIEERRKDHYQMLTHHCVTILLMGGSHAYRQHRAGNAILVLMDVVDLLFPLAKILKYLNLQTLCDCTFGLFVIFWFAARHVGYLTICWSIYTHVNQDAMAYGTYSTVTGKRLSADGGQEIMSNLLQPFLDPAAKTVSFNANIRWQFLGLLLGLQCITIAWFVMICRVVARVLRGLGADDTRSDDEGEDEEEPVEPNPTPTTQPASAPFRLSEKHAAASEPKYIEVESTSEDYSRPTTVPVKRLSTKRRSKGIGSGLNLSEHKDILNRIGCLSEEQLAREREKREESMSPRPGSSYSKGMAWS